MGEQERKESHLMKVLRIGLLAAVAVVGAVLFASVEPDPPAAHAEPYAILGLNESSCTPLAVAFAGLPATEALAACQNMAIQDNLERLVRCTRSGDLDVLRFPPEKRCIPPSVPDVELFPIVPEDLSPVDLDGNQLHEQQNFIVFAFVRDDFPVRFTTNVGTFIDQSSNLPPATELGQDYECNTSGFAPGDATGDPDCDGDPATLGDGVVVTRIKIRGPEIDPKGTYTVTAIQEGIGIPMEFTVAGRPETIELVPLFNKDRISTGATPTTFATEREAQTDCNFVGSLEGVLEAVSHPEKTVIIARALDSDGTALAGTLLNWNVPVGERAAGGGDPRIFGPTPQGAVALPQTPTLDLGGDLGQGFPQFVCGYDEPGTLHIEVEFDGIGGPASASPPASEEVGSIDIEVVRRVSTISLAADPPEIDCNGTNSSTVTATLTNADGEPVANGTDINFSVVALGTTTPLKVDSGEGTGSTVVTPLSGAGTIDPRGVTVTVSALGERTVDVLSGDNNRVAVDGNVILYNYDPDDEDLGFGELRTVTNSILVRCTGAGAAAPPPPPAGGAGPGGAPSGVISGPDTGTGEATRSVEGAWLPALALGLAAAGMLLAGAGRVLRRR
jgi:hypothetical protein